MNLIKNNRFRTGSVVDIYHTPVYESYTVSITDSASGGSYKVIAEFPNDMSIEMFGVGDICAFSFGAGEIIEKTAYTLTVEFPNSMFGTQDIAKYVGYENQHTLIFLKTGRVEANFTVAQYKEVVSQATYGHAKVIYNLKSDAEITLTPIRLVDDGLLNKILYSKGFVLKSCNDEDYVPDTSWNQTFPIELSGTSIDPVYRRAFLAKREMTSTSRKAKAKMTFKLIG